MTHFEIDKPDRWYTYIFVRQDISQEQQLVQSSHVSCELALQLKEFEAECGKYGLTTTPCNLHNLYFKVIGVKDGLELEQVRWSLFGNGIDFCLYNEPDIDNEVTAVATYPVQYGKESCNWLYGTYNDKLLRFNNESV